MTNIIVFGVIGLVMVFAIFSIINGNKPKGKQEAQKKELFRKLYKILSRNFITQGSIRKIYSKLANLCIYKREELYVLAVQYFCMSWFQYTSPTCLSLFEEFQYLLSNKE